VPSSSETRSRDPRDLARAAWSRYGVAYTAATRRPAPPWLLDKLTEFSASHNRADELSRALPAC